MGTDQVYLLPKELDEKVARLHLPALGASSRSSRRSRRTTLTCRWRALTSRTPTVTRCEERAGAGSFSTLTPRRHGIKGCEAASTRMWLRRVLEMRLLSAAIGRFFLFGFWVADACRVVT